MKKSKKTKTKPSLKARFYFFMEQDYLVKLLDLVRQQNGGVVLQRNGQSEAVVLSMERYLQLQKAENIQANKHTILITGGAGYIGTYCSRELASQGHKLVILNHRINSKFTEALPSDAILVDGDYGDSDLVSKLCFEHGVDTVLHLASKIEVEESFVKPELYLDNNVRKTADLLEVLYSHRIKRFLFASTCGVYGVGKGLPLKESDPTEPINPYAHSKLLVEQLLSYASKWLGIKTTVLRLANVAGCDPAISLVRGNEDAIIGIILRVLRGEMSHLTINGDSYETLDGTPVRDFVHVLDIAKAFSNALTAPQEHVFELYNVGSGSGMTIKQIFDVAVEVSGKMAPMIIGPTRPGDIPISMVDTTKAKQAFHFEALNSTPEKIFSDLFTTA